MYHQCREKTLSKQANLGALLLYRTGMSPGRGDSKKVVSVEGRPECLDSISEDLRQLEQTGLLLLLLVFSWVLGIESRASSMLGKHCTLSAVFRSLPRKLKCVGS